MGSILQGPPREGELSRTERRPVRETERARYPGAGRPQQEYVMCDGADADADAVRWGADTVLMNVDAGVRWYSGRGLRDGELQSKPKLRYEVLR